MHVINAILFTGNSFVSSSRDGTICIWNMESLQMVKKLEKHTDEINCLDTAVSYRILYNYPSPTHSVWEGYCSRRVS